MDKKGHNFIIINFIVSGLHKSRPESRDSSQSIYSRDENSSLSESFDADYEDSRECDENQSTSTTGRSFLYKLVLSYIRVLILSIYLSMNFNRKWTPELEDTVVSVKTQMEEVCDQYFIDIQHQAIKV